jgi:YidC/Oxa1 family membrane protein insertase
VESLRLLIDACLIHFHFILNDWGVAIIFLSLGIRFVLFPVQAFNFFQQRRLRKIQPEIDRLTAEFKEDPLRAFKEIQKVKRREGVRTWSTLVLTLIQLPIFLSMYRVVSAAHGLSGTHFIWISSLAAPDGLYILPLLVALTTYLQLRVTSTVPGKDNPQSAFILKLMPAMSFIFMASLPSALVLYYATSGVFQLFAETSLSRLGG